MLGSTQKLNDVYKPVRTNMATKVLLRLGEEEIETLDRSYHFSNEQKAQLSEFNIGQGMVLAGGNAAWPIELRGAPCGLGLGDQHWLDRYGRAWGARVRQTTDDYWQVKHDDADWWVHVPDAEVREMNSPPEIGDTYSEWYLLSTDFPEGTGREDVGRELVRGVLEDRRDYPLKTNLSLVETDAMDRQRDLSMSPSDSDDAGVDEIAEEYGVPQAIHDWLTDRTQSGREKMVEVCRALQDAEDIRTTADIADLVSFSESTLRNYTSDGLKPCIEKNTFYELTPVGEQVANIDWDSLEERL